MPEQLQTDTCYELRGSADFSDRPSDRQRVPTSLPRMNAPTGLLKAASGDHDANAPWKTARTRQV
jgi:hypothetical protein